MGGGGRRGELGRGGKTEPNKPQNYREGQGKQDKKVPSRILRETEIEIEGERGRTEGGRKKEEERERGR